MLQSSMHSTLHVVLPHDSSTSPRPGKQRPHLGIHDLVLEVGVVSISMILRTMALAAVAFSPASRTAGTASDVLVVVLEQDYRIVGYNALVPEDVRRRRRVVGRRASLRRFALTRRPKEIRAAKAKRCAQACGQHDPESDQHDERTARQGAATGRPRGSSRASSTAPVMARRSAYRASVRAGC
jgi:hypothetical protein